METTIVKVFEKPQAVVSISNISVDIAKCTFALNLAYTLKGKRKATIMDVKGNITPELKEWLSVAHQEKVKVTIDGNDSYQPTGVSSTGFQRFLTRIGKEFKPGILKEMVFTSQNNSEVYDENPFKLVLLGDKAVLSLVNIASKRRQESVDPNTGEITVHYSQKYFKNNNDEYRKSYVTKKYFLRLIIQTMKSVPVAQEAAAQPEPAHA